MTGARQLTDAALEVYRNLYENLRKAHAGLGYVDDSVKARNLVHEVVQWLTATTYYQYVPCLICRAEFPVVVQLTDTAHTHAVVCEECAGRIEPEAMTAARNLRSLEATDEH